MKKRLLGTAAAIALCLTSITPALAADPANMGDIAGHWAEPTIVWGMEQGLFNGMNDTSFSPETPMTREMFVTVLSRIEGIDQEAYKNDYINTLYTDVNENMYSAAAINWATRIGIVNGMGDGSFQPTGPVTREQMAAMVIRYASNCNYALNTVSEALPGEFTDLDRVAEYAREPLASLKATGILNGYENGDGTYRFGPLENATRAQCAAVFQRLSHARAAYTDREWIEPQELTLLPETVSLIRGETTSLVTTVLPENSCNQTITWVSMDPGIASVDRNGSVTAVSAGTVDVRAYTYNGLTKTCKVTCRNVEGLGSETESFREKTLRVFAKTYPSAFAARNAYTSAEEAASHMVQITVPVWNFKDSTHTEKVSTTRTLQVHENIAPTIQAIFEEIYNGTEKFPINDVGCYRWDPESEHCVGLAIDINYNSNYYCDPAGNALVGAHWDPENDPYSIPADGDVVKAFRKYGFTRGVNWNSGYKDYMHFSYFGT